MMTAKSPLGLQDRKVVATTGVGTSVPAAQRAHFHLLECLPCRVKRPRIRFWPTFEVQSQATAIVLCGL